MGRVLSTITIEFNFLSLQSRIEKRAPFQGDGDGAYWPPLRLAGGAGATWRFTWEAFGTF